MNQSNNQIAQRQQPKLSVMITTAGYQKLINSVIQDPKEKARFITSIMSTYSVSPAIQTCAPASIISCGLLGASLKLSPSPQLGQYYMVPFKSKAKIDRRTGEMLEPETIKATFILGYKGMMQLALRSGEYSDIDAIDIREGEYLGKDPDTGRPRFRFTEDDEERDAKPIIGYMAYFERRDGFKKRIYWSKSKMLRHADQYSQAFSALAYEKLQRGEIPQADMWKYSSFWYKNFDEMAKKTMLRHMISHYCSLSSEMQTAIENDNAPITYDESGNVVIEEEPALPSPIDDRGELHTEETVSAASPDNQAPPAQIDINDL